jgi:hypothetical protein
MLLLKKIGYGKPIRDCDRFSSYWPLRELSGVFDAADPDNTQL